jgi:predicted CXXCH cytochrome family protein
VGQPTGSSRLCLSCHDGTVALTETYNKARPIKGTIRISDRDAGLIGTNLSDDHPISFVYDSGLAMENTQLRNPSSLPKELPLDKQGQLQCTTCHDPHNNSRGRFLRMDNRGSAMCISCHKLDGWATAAHATSSSSVASAAGDPWGDVRFKFKTVKDLACASCHRPHNAPGRERLLRNEAEEDNCLVCHDGTVARGNLAAEFRKTSVHPITETTGIHDPSEDPRTMKEHVECGDCHDPHEAGRSGSASPPFIKPSMKGASGLTSTGVPTAKATYEYEVCYKCHADRNPVVKPLVDRWVRNNSMREKFDVSNASFHPVEGIGKNISVPSFLQPWTETSKVYCTDCHGSNNSGGPKGTHGSIYRPLLVRKYVYVNPINVKESPQAYALCYGCHNRLNILADKSFEKHDQHIRVENTSCSVCHDPHGVEDNTHLINFDREYVFPSKTAGRGPIFEDRGFRRGSCTLLCHGKDHNDEDYRP